MGPTHFSLPCLVGFRSILLGDTWVITCSSKGLSSHTSEDPSPVMRPSFSLSQWVSVHFPRSVLYGTLHDCGISVSHMQAFLMTPMQAPPPSSSPGSIIRQFKYKNAFYLNNSKQLSPREEECSSLICGIKRTARFSSLNSYCPFVQMYQIFTKFKSC